MSTEPTIPTLFVGNADAGVNNERIRLGENREDLVLGGPSQLLTESEFLNLPSKLGVVFQRETDPIEELTAKQLKDELEALGVDFPRNAPKDDLVTRLAEARAAQVNQVADPVVPDPAADPVQPLS